MGYSDQDDTLSYVLKPLNPYGDSKNDFDKWALAQERKPFFWAGLKFFNVYGPNEYHKGRMASVVFHAFNQINATGEMKLFRSHHPDYQGRRAATRFRLREGCVLHVPLPDGASETQWVVQSGKW
jgi:ADP-L-glycero-D-manno-heptose 6-epimerase